MLIQIDLKIRISKTHAPGTEGPWQRPARGGWSIQKPWLAADEKHMENGCLKGPYRNKTGNDKLTCLSNQKWKVNA